MRTFAFGVLSLAVILVGFLVALVKPPAAPQLFEWYAWAIVGVFWGVAGKSTVEALATGTGVRGAVAALMTDQKPPGAK
jgi:hypothetical protein